MNTVKLVKIYPKSSESSLDLRVEVNGNEYEFSIRFTGDKDEMKLTILKDPSWWHVKTDTFGYPSD